MTTTHKSYVRCILFKILNVVSIVLMLALIKLVEAVPVSQVNVTRTVLGLAVMALTFIAVWLLPLPEVVTLQYSQPLFVVAFSALFLREIVGTYRWGAVAFEFVGVHKRDSPLQRELHLFRHGPSP